MVSGISGIVGLAAVVLTWVGAPVAAADAGTAGLDPMLAGAYLLAQEQAQADGVPLSITSGYRSPGEQQQLWEDALHTYGDPDTARQWVLPPEQSTHVQGRAIDVGPPSGAAWLEANGSRWGLCRSYANEWWHFEMSTYPGGVCPPPVADATER